ncbi:hypothetical protein [Legionella sp. km772]|uniref:hypothetical protein n=1 Tax=Legionella sp. km772 TaxID=2498111 RepID=UPI000F8F732D|nr:hypothetical protein [Legionella sp. km772]RUR05179.1 hypothetical protein ELY15_14640 [Legionella sp. km772]
MGLFDRFRRDVRKDHLLIAADGKIPIERIDAWSATKKIDYAWEVYNSSKDKYTVDHKAGALEFLRRQFKIPQELSREEQVRLIGAGVKRKTDSHIPSYEDLRSPRPDETPQPPPVTPVIVRAPRPEPEHPPTTPMKKLKEVTWPTYANRSVQRFLESINKDVEQLNLGMVQIY